MIGHADPKSAARSAFTDYGGENGDAQFHHLTKIDRDGFSDMTFFRADPGKSAGRIDEGNHRQMKFFAELHQAERLAITFGMGPAKIPQHVFLRIAAFVICDHDATVLAQHRDSAGHRLVVAEYTVAVEFVPIRETTLHIIEGEGPLER